MNELLKERERLDAIEEKLIAKWSKMSDKQLFVLSKVEINPSDLQYPLAQQYIPSPINCSSCGELTEKSRTIKKNGKRICKVCAGVIKIKEI